MKQKYYFVLSVTLMFVLILLAACAQKPFKEEIFDKAQNIFVCPLGTKTVKTDSEPQCISLEGTELEQHCDEHSTHAPTFLFCQEESALEKIYLNEEFQIKVNQTVFLESQNNKIRLLKIINQTTVEVDTLDNENRYFRYEFKQNERIYWTSYYMTLLNVISSDQIAVFYLEEIPQNLNVTEEAASIEKYFVPPNFVPQEDWAIKYVKLFKQAIKEKYNIDDETLDKNLMIVSVEKGTKSNAVIHYIYKIDWALFNGYGDNNGLSFIVQDNLGNELTNQQILENIKKSLIPIFTIKNIISNEQAINSCNQPVFPNLRQPFYTQDNNIIYDKSRNDLIYFCYKISKEKGNKCSRDIMSLTSGNTLLSQEFDC